MLISPKEMNKILQVTGSEVTNRGKRYFELGKVKIIESTETSCVMDIITGKSGKFDIIYKRDNEKDIVLNITINSF